MKHAFIFCLVLVSFQSAYTQDIEKLVKGGQDDANYLIKGYVAPVLNCVGTGFAQGWYNTAKPHKLIGIDLTVTASAIYFPSSDLTYRVEDSQLKNLQVIPSSAQGIDAPTILGSGPAPTYQLVDNNNNVKTAIPNGTVQGAEGLDLKKNGVSFIPTAMVQLGIGLPKNTDLKIRFFPNTKIGDAGSASMIGFGVMHDIKQHIPGIKKMPFDLSAFVGYTKAKVEATLDTNNPDQKATFETSATTIQGVISKKFSVITFYGGLGYNITSASLAVRGKYAVNNTGIEVPIAVDASASQSGPRVTVGMRLKLAIFTFHGDYTLQKYNALTVGFGLSVR